MEHWGFTLVFIFSLLVIIRNILVFARKLFAQRKHNYLIEQIQHTKEYKTEQSNVKIC